MTTESESRVIDAIDGMTERLHKASGIAGLIRVAGKDASNYALENAAWAIEGLLDEVSALASGEGLRATT